MNRRRALQNKVTEKIVQVRKHRPDYLLILMVGFLMLTGLIFIYAIGPQKVHSINLSSGGDLSSTYFVIKQTIVTLISVVCLIGVIFVPLEFFKKKAFLILGVALLACFLLMIMGNMFGLSIAEATLGAHRWFRVGGIGFQPAEFLKFAMLLFVAKFLASSIKQKNVNSWSETLWPLMFILMVCAFFVIFMQKDMGTGVALISIVGCQLLVANLSWKNIAILLAGLLVLLAMLVAIAPHRMERIMAFTSSSAGEEASSAQYHVEQAEVAIGSGGLFGLGIGGSVQSTGYLPEAMNDSIFAVMGETVGFVGLMIVILMFTSVLFRILKISQSLQDDWMKLVAVGLFGWIFAHVLFNIASMIGVMPLTGITLPLLSFGGTSMLFIATAIGIVVQISRYTSHNVKRRY